jgi:hypothetical protein
MTDAKAVVFRNFDEKIPVTRGQIGSSLTLKCLHLQGARSSFIRIIIITSTNIGAGCFNHLSTPSQKKRNYPDKAKSSILVAA